MAPPDDRGVPITSEMIEPFALMLVARLFARCEAVKGKDRWEFEDACACLWWATEGLLSIAVAVSTATHFTIAAGNHQTQIARYIEKELGVDPYKCWRRRL